VLNPADMPDDPAAWPAAAPQAVYSATLIRVKSREVVHDLPLHRCVLEYGDGHGHGD
jgi:hypothetical protein